MTSNVHAKFVRLWLFRRILCNRSRRFDVHLFWFYKSTTLSCMYIYLNSIILGNFNQFKTLRLWESRMYYTYAFIWTNCTTQFNDTYIFQFILYYLSLEPKFRNSFYNNLNSIHLNKIFNFIPVLIWRNFQCLIFILIFCYKQKWTNPYFTFVKKWYTLNKQANLYTN